MRSSSLNPSFDVAQRFLDALEPNGKFTFQTFDDDQDRKDKRLAKQLNGTLREHFDQLRSLQEKGAGIFVTINQTDLKGRIVHDTMGGSRHAPHGGDAGLGDDAHVVLATPA